MATSYANNGAVNWRRSEILISSTSLTLSTFNTAQLYNLLDGSYTTPLLFANSNSGSIILFDWGLGASIVVDEFKWYQSGSGSGMGTWVLEGSPDLSSWTTIGASFTLGGSATTTVSRTNSTGYRAYRLRLTSGTTNNTVENRAIDFKIEDITPQATRPSWYNTGGHGSRNSVVTVTADQGASAGSYQALVNGVNNSALAVDSVSPNTFSSGNKIKFDFGSGNSAVIDGFTLYQNGTNTFGTWKARGSNDGSTWFDIGSSFTLGGDFAKEYMLGGNTTGYRYFALEAQGSAFAAGPILEEVEFRIMGVDPVSENIYKLSGYGIISPDDARAYKLSGYAIIRPVSGGKQTVVVVPCT